MTQIFDRDSNEIDAMDDEICKVCLKPCDPYRNPSLLCRGDCNRTVHIACLKRGALPTNFVGDVFYELYCSECNPLGEEIITRDKMPWLTTITLVLYNLREKSGGISRRGYFHWKSDISTFVDVNWNYLFKKTVYVCM